MPKTSDRPSGKTVLHQGPVSEHLANERTHLASLRTAVALITFGLAINRFSLFLILNDKLGPGAAPFVPLVGAEQVGLAVVILGALMIVWAAIRYTQVTTQIDRGEYRPNTTMVWILTTAMFLFVVASLSWLFRR